METLSIPFLAELARSGSLIHFLRQSLLIEAISQESLNDNDRQLALLQFAQDRGIANQDELENYRVTQVLTPDALAIQVEMQVRIQRHCQRLFQAKAEARFLERKQQLDQVVYSLLRLEDEGLAHELYLQLLEDGADFAELAARYAEGPERATRGIVGPVALAQAHPQLVERLTSAAIGEIQEPFQIDRWWLLFRLESFTSAVFDDAMALQMSRELFEQWLEQALETRLNQLRPLLLNFATDIEGV